MIQERIIHVSNVAKIYTLARQKKLHFGVENYYSLIKNLEARFCLVGVFFLHTRNFRFFLDELGRINSITGRA